MNERTQVDWSPLIGGFVLASVVWILAGFEVGVVLLLGLLLGAVATLIKYSYDRDRKAATASKSDDDVPEATEIEESPDDQDVMLRAIFESAVPEHHQLFVFAEPATLATWQRVKQGDDLVLVSKHSAVQYRHIRTGDHDDEFNGTEVRGFARGLDSDEEYKVRGNGGWLPISMYANDQGTGWWSEMKIVGWNREPGVMRQHSDWLFGAMFRTHENDPPGLDIFALDRGGGLFDYENEYATWWEERGFTLRSDDDE